MQIKLLSHIFTSFNKCPFAISACCELINQYQSNCNEHVIKMTAEANNKLLIS